MEAAGSGSNLGFNYYHLGIQDKESLTEVATYRSQYEWIVWLEITNQKNHSSCRSAEAHKRGPANFFSQIHERQVYNYFWKPNSTRSMLKLLH
jgi:hypothetical protein